VSGSPVINQEKRIRVDLEQTDLFHGWLVGELGGDSRWEAPLARTISPRFCKSHYPFLFNDRKCRGEVELDLPGDKVILTVHLYYPLC